jgi:hypothetical protein
MFPAEIQLSRLFVLPDAGTVREGNRPPALDEEVDVVRNCDPSCSCIAQAEQQASEQQCDGGPGG